MGCTPPFLSKEHVSWLKKQGGHKNVAIAKKEGYETYRHHQDNRTIFSNMQPDRPPNMKESRARDWMDCEEENDNDSPMGADTQGSA